MTLNDLLDKVCNGMSDNVTSQKLGVSRQFFSAMRNGRKTPSDDVLEVMIEMSGVDPVQAYMTVYAVKIHNPVVSKAFREYQASAA